MIKYTKLDSSDINFHLKKKLELKEDIVEAYYNRINKDKVSYFFSINYDGTKIELSKDVYLKDLLKSNTVENIAKREFKDFINSKKSINDNFISAIDDFGKNDLFSISSKESIQYSIEGENKIFFDFESFNNSEFVNKNRKNVYPITGAYFEETNKIDPSNTIKKSGVSQTQNIFFIDEYKDALQLSFDEGRKGSPAYKSIAKFHDIDSDQKLFTDEFRLKVSKKKTEKSKLKFILDSINKEQKNIFYEENGKRFYKEYTNKAFKEFLNNTLLKNNPLIIQGNATLLDVRVINKFRNEKTDARFIDNFTYFTHAKTKVPLIKLSNYAEALNIDTASHVASDDVNLVYKIYNKLTDINKAGFISDEVFNDFLNSHTQGNNKKSLGRFFIEDLYDVTDEEKFKNKLGKFLYYFRKNVKPDEVLEYDNIKDYLKELEFDDIFSNEIINIEDYKKLDETGKKFFTKVTKKGKVINYKFNFKNQVINNVNRILNKIVNEEARREGVDNLNRKEYINTAKKRILHRTLGGKDFLSTIKGIFKKTSIGVPITAGVLLATAYGIEKTDDYLNSKARKLHKQRLNELDQELEIQSETTKENLDQFTEINRISRVLNDIEHKISTQKLKQMSLNLLQEDAEL